MPPTVVDVEMSLAGPVFVTTVTKDGTEYQVTAWIDVRRLKAHVMEVLEDKADIIGDPAWDNRFHPDGGLIYFLSRKD